MQIGYALPDVSSCHFRTDVAERSDKVLIESIVGGDNLAMQVLFARHYVRVYRFALRLTGNPPTAEDIVYEVFFDVWRQAAGFEAKSQVSTWLLAITRNKAFSSIRRHSESQLDEEFASTIADPGLAGFLGTGGGGGTADREVAQRRVPYAGVFESFEGVGNGPIIQKICDRLFRL
jgi:RNA polymerase sigma factor (sigma-70 family)